MSDYLMRLATKAFGGVESIRPRMASIFEAGADVIQQGTVREPTEPVSAFLQHKTGEAAELTQTRDELAPASLAQHLDSSSSKKVKSPEIQVEEGNSGRGIGSDATWKKKIVDPHNSNEPERSFTEIPEPASNDVHDANLAVKERLQKGERDAMSSIKTPVTPSQVSEVANLDGMGKYYVPLREESTGHTASTNDVREIKSAGDGPQNQGHENVTVPSRESLPLKDLEPKAEIPVTPKLINRVAPQTGATVAHERPDQVGLPRESPTIRVTIGRVDVRAITPPPVALPKKASQARPKLSLGDYLEERRTGVR